MKLGRQLFLPFLSKIGFGFAYGLQLDVVFKRKE